MAKRLVDKGLDWRTDMYFCSLSVRTIVYKGMTNANVRRGLFFLVFSCFGGDGNDLGGCLVIVW